MSALRHGGVLAACLAALLGASAGAAEPTLDYPANYREWIFLTSGLDMTYSDPAMKGHSMFDNVFVDPASYRQFLATGRWPEGTLLVKEARAARGRGSINRHGHYQAGEPMALEVHAKDSARYPGGWAFFEFDGTAPASAVPREADCYTCHAAHGALDTTFVQFYPTLLPVAERAGTAKR